MTGGAGGIGRAISARLAADGHHVVVADRDAEAAPSGCDVDRRGGDRASISPNSASVDAAIDGVLSRHGRIDVLVNAAGIHLQKLVVEMSDDDWDRIQRVNARGPFLACRAVAKPMMRGGRGRIVNIVTRLGFGNPYSSAYMASKNALWGFTQCLAIELAAYGDHRECGGARPCRSRHRHGEAVPREGGEARLIVGGFRGAGAEDDSRSAAGARRRTSRPRSPMWFRRKRPSSPAS